MGYKKENFFFFQAEDGIRDTSVTGVQTCALPICHRGARKGRAGEHETHPRQETGCQIERRRELVDRDDHGEPPRSRATLSATLAASFTISNMRKAGSPKSTKRISSSVVSPSRWERASSSKSSAQRCRGKPAIPAPIAGTAMLRHPRSRA